MPEQLHPPYNVTQPRQLVRWLDVNSQNGPLGRCQTYITIPAFNVANTWNGYSDIVCAFNYTAPNNFSFTQVRGFAVPLGLPFLLCVSYVDSMDNVVRYALNSNKNAVMFFDTVPYTNQMILKNFRIEVWSCNATAVMVFPVTLYTSVMQNVDTRLGVDLALVGVGNEDLMFSDPTDGLVGIVAGQNDVYIPDALGAAYQINGVVPGTDYIYYPGNSYCIIDKDPPTLDQQLTGNFTSVAGHTYFFIAYGSYIGQRPTAVIATDLGTFDLPLTFPNTINTNI